MKKVLVIDDTKNIRLLLSKCLEHAGYEVDIAADGVEALLMFQNKKYDLAFLDIKMPRISGTEVLKSIRDMGIRTPVIIITAYGTVKNAVECTKLGAVTYLQKPFTAEKVRSILSELMDPYEDSNRIPETEILLQQAQTYIEQGSFTHALTLLKSAISKQLDNANIYLLLSKAYQGLGDQDNADRFFRTYQVFSR